MPFDEGSPPGHATFFVVSATGGDIAPDVSTIHYLKLAGSRLPAATRTGHGHQARQNR